MTALNQKKSAAEIHDAAMELADAALAHRRARRRSAAAEAFRMAAAEEERAAALVTNAYDKHVLSRSAAALRRSAEELEPRR